jgi:enolase
MDPASSELFHEGRYEFAKSGEPSRSTTEMIALFERLVERYPLVFIEDGLSEHDWDGWKVLTERLGSCNIVRTISAFNGGPSASGTYLFSVTPACCLCR